MTAIAVSFLASRRLLFDAMDGKRFRARRAEGAVLPHLEEIRLEARDEDVRDVLLERVELSPLVPVENAAIPRRYLDLVPGLARWTEPRAFSEDAHEGWILHNTLGT